MSETYPATQEIDDQSSTNQPETDSDVLLTHSFQGAPSQEQAPRPNVRQENSTQSDSDFSIPEEYRAQQLEDGNVVNAWSDKVKSVEDLWKLAANSQKVLGKRHVVPDFDNASPEEVNDYFNQVRPSSPEDYVFNSFEGYEESGLEGEVGQLLYDCGISKYQADNLIAGHNEIMMREAAEAFSEDNFNNIISDVFGKDNDFEISRTSRLISDNLGEEHLNALDSLPNEALALIYSLAHNMNKSYGAHEYGVGVDSKPGRIQEKDYKKLQGEKFRELWELKNRGHTNEEKQKIIDAIARLKDEEINARGK